MPSWWRIEALRSEAALLFLIATLAIVQPNLPVANADQVTTEVTLYAHTDASAASVGGRVLSLSGNATSRNAADVTDGLAFTLVPSLSAPLHILGTVDAYVWLQSQESVRGTLRVTVSEVTQNASVVEIRSSSVTIALPPTNAYQVQFGLGRVDSTLETGSTLKFEVQFSPVRPVRVMLLWDDPSAPTRTVLRVEALPKITVTILDSRGKASTIFPENETGKANLFAQATIEDPFRGVNVQMVTLSLTNSSGIALVTDAPMNLTSRVEFPFRLEYALAMAIPSGSFNVTLSVQDAAKRTFLTARQIIVTRFYTLIVQLVDAQKRPLSGLNVSVSALGQLTDTVTTDSTGWATIRVPSSKDVGSLILQVWKGGVALLSREMDVESDLTRVVTVELYDWKIHIVTTFLIWNVPVAGATVDLYLNGTLFASNLTDTNGVARFAELPGGTYEVGVRSFLGSDRFLNVTHSLEVGETALNLPILSRIPESTVLILVAIAIVATFGVVAAARRKMRMRHFKHVGELLGGVVPASTMIMIVGPSGSGKSLLLQNMLADFLRLGRRCVYVSNSELPSKIRERLERMGLDVDEFQDDRKLRFIDAYSGATGAISHEKYSVASPRDLTGLGIQMTSCLEELGEAGDVFLDSLTPVVTSGGFERGFDFVEYYGSRTTKSGGTFLYVASTTIEPKLLTRLEEASDCVLQTERSIGPGKIRGRLLVKKARHVEHEHDWVGYEIRRDGRMQFVSLRTEKS